MPSGDTTPATGLDPSAFAGQQLAEFMSFVTGQPDPELAIRRGVERAAEVIEAEVACIFRAGVEPVTIGFPANSSPALAARLAGVERGSVQLPGLGDCAVTREPLGEDRREWLVVARMGTADFSLADQDLLRGMARAIGLARDMLARRRLLECLSEIQRRIARRDVIDEIVRLIVDGGTELTGSDMVLLLQAEEDGQGPPRVRASTGLRLDALASLESGGQVARMTDRAQRDSRMVVIEDYQTELTGAPELKAEGIRSLVAVPVRADDSVSAVLLAGTRAAERRYSDSELDALRTFAEHAGMALADAELVADTRFRSLHDALTGLPNRTYLAERLDKVRAGGVSVLFIDLDGFKRINDSLGHGTGDQLLVAAAQRITQCVRAEDTAARLGGDEFAVLIETSDERVGQRVARHILAEFERPFPIAGRDLVVRASVGLAVSQCPDDDPLADSDLAMYEAKSAGGGQLSAFAPTMRKRAQQRLDMETQLPLAAANGELFLEYQPIRDLRTGSVVMAEALIRWAHPERGRLAPSDFLPAVEGTNQITTLRRWVLETACRQVVAWQERAPGLSPRVTVNLSAVELHSFDVVDAVASTLGATGLPAGQLVLELTETALAESLERAADSLTALRSLGVLLAIDDFGTGYCSLQYLKQFPIDYLKVAETFIADLSGPSPDLRMFRAIAGLGASWGIEVVAEGIEQESQLSLLRELGCEYGQGFMLGRPMHADALARSLSARAEIVRT
ncbi:MAG: EAL domain-containing protein [Solirubrobacterales bacterium]|nr:EAL domain-containing protein [Solirubrobacterales bacterium]